MDFDLLRLCWKLSIAVIWNLHADSTETDKVSRWSVLACWGQKNFRLLISTTDLYMALLCDRHSTCTITEYLQYPSKADISSSLRHRQGNWGTDMIKQFFSCTLLWSGVQAYSCSSAHHQLNIQARKALWEVHLSAGVSKLGSTQPQLPWKWHLITIFCNLWLQFSTICDCNF